MEVDPTTLLHGAGDGEGEALRKARVMASVLLEVGSVELMRVLNDDDHVDN